MSKSEPSSYVTELANSMQSYPVQHIVSGSKLLFDRQLADVNFFAEYLRADNCIVMVKHKGLQGATDRTERWYGTAYSLCSITMEQMRLWTQPEALSVWSSRLHLPMENPFVPTDFRLRLRGDGDGDDENASPVLIMDSAVDLPVPLVHQHAHDDAAAAAASSSSASASTPAEAQDKQEDEHHQHDGEPDEHAVADSVDHDDGEGAEKDEAEHDDDDGDADADADAESERSGDSFTPLPVAGRAMMLWHKQDFEWKLPKVNVMIKMESRMVYHDDHDDDEVYDAHDEHDVEEHDDSKHDDDDDDHDNDHVYNALIIVCICKMMCL